MPIYKLKGRRNFRRKGLRKKPYVRKPKPAYRKSIARVVKRVISRQAELKTTCYSTTLSLSTLQSTTSSLAGNILCVTPCQSTYGYTISQGNGDNNRVGNQINIKKLVHSFAIYPNAYNATINVQPRPVLIRLYYFKSKWNPVNDLLLTQLCGASANFFDNASSDTGFSGGLLDLNRRIQNENYTYLCHRTFKVGNSQPVYGGATVEYYPGSNNDFKMSVVNKVDLSRYVKSKWTYNDAGQVTKAWIWCVAQVICADGSVLATTQNLVSMQSQIYVAFTDE